MKIVRYKWSSNRENVMDVMVSTDMLWNTYVWIIAQCMFDLINSQLIKSLHSSRPYPCVERVIDVLQKWRITLQNNFIPGNIRENICWLLTLQRYTVVCRGKVYKRYWRRSFKHIICDVYNVFSFYIMLMECFEVHMTP